MFLPKRIERTLFVLFLVGLFAACTPSNKPILPSSAEQPQSDTGESITHPEFANWSQFNVGAKATRYRVVTNEYGEVRVTTTFFLEEKSDDHVTVRSQVDVERPDRPLEQNPPQSTRFEAKFSLPRGLTEEFFKLPNAKAKLVGEEKMEVAGRQVEAEVYEWTESNEAGPMAIKLWRSNAVPGRIIRQEMLIESSKTKTVEEMKEVAW